MDVKFNPYSVSFEYDTDTSNCHCEGICRCGILTNIHCESVSLDTLFDITAINLETKRTVKCALSSIESYCLDRLVRIYKLYDRSMWEGSAGSGYYGEEFNYSSIFHPNLALCTILIKEMCDLDRDIDKVKLVLDKEYSYLLPEIESCNSVSVQPRLLSELYGQNEYFSRIKRDSTDGYAYNEKVKPRAIVLGNRIIDGYHRLANVEDKGGIVEVLVLE